MAWVRVDDHFDEHPKMAACGPLGMALWVAGLAYCNRQLTDGFIPRSVARRLLDFRFEFGGLEYRISIVSPNSGEDAESDLVIELLLRAGLWDEVDGGYQVHDYHDYQPTREQILAERDAAKQRMARVRGNGGRSSDEVQANFERSSGTPTPTPTPDPDPTPTPIPLPVRAAGLTDVQQELLNHLEFEVHRLVYGGSGYPPPGFCEDLVRLGATRGDIDFAIQASLGKGEGYVRSVLQRRVRDREQGRDPDAVKQRRPSNAMQATPAQRDRFKAVVVRGVDDDGKPIREVAP